jgi:hypothetical protein
MRKMITKLCKCGTEFEGPANATSQVRCPVCQKEHIRNLQKDYHRDYEKDQPRKEIKRYISETNRAFFCGIDRSIADQDGISEFHEIWNGRFLNAADVKDEVPLGYYPEGLLIKFEDGIKKVVGKELVPA